MAKCNVCFRHCDIREGGRGFCGARSCKDGQVYPNNYGRLTSLALDPIEKKPLRRFHPGTMILSLGSYGCNLRCPFCQNSEISWSDHALSLADSEDGAYTKTFMPEELVEIAKEQKPFGNIGIAFTYNEPLIGYEFVRDTAKLAHDRGLLNVLVSNGTASLEVLYEIAPYIDAMNIDLKGFSREYYNGFLGGSLEMTLEFIKAAVTLCHVELTTLVVPGENDSATKMRELSSWIADLKDSRGSVIGPDIPLHLLRYYPRFKLADREPTSFDTIKKLAETAEEKLRYVYSAC
ncbi:MAG: AmmeMemoRadiSam system radical SAM enzyme [Lachnospiraceae bacterium]|nr:AmmeMemoRadiSam system radical SAM enzyme [Lachnospiraceae bacterium]